MSSIFFHPDYTVGFGITPNPAAARLADYTADREFHPALKIAISLSVYHVTLWRGNCQEGEREKRKIRRYYRRKELNSRKFYGNDEI